MAVDSYIFCSYLQLKYLFIADKVCHDMLGVAVIEF